jgi:HlyD family secretion protein
VNVIVDFDDLSTAHSLGHGYRVEVGVIVWESSDVLKVPTSALFRRGERWAVFVVEHGRARLRTIEIGHRNGSAAEALSGLSVGEQVVVHPGDALVDKSRVTPRSE